MDAAIVLANIRDLAVQFASERHERQQRRRLDSADFDRLCEAGFQLTGVPIEYGGIWESIPRSTRPICDMLRVLAHGDASIAMVCAMHPSVLNFWMATPEVPTPFQQAWEAQRRVIFRGVCGGAWWGTIASEPGASGDLSRSKATARRQYVHGNYRPSGQKNFGSGSGITTFMLTVAVPEGEATPDIFFLDMRGIPWDGSAGVTFHDFPATRIAWPGQLSRLQQATAGLTQCCFTAVIAGVAEIAMETAREQVARRRQEMRAYERLEWTRAELEFWLIQQAYEGMLRAVEEGQDGRMRAVQAKTAIAELAESVLHRICRVIGGGTRSPVPRPLAIGSRMCARWVSCARPWALLMISCLVRNGHDGFGEKTRTRPGSRRAGEFREFCPSRISGRNRVARGASWAVGPMATGKTADRNWSGAATTASSVQRQ
jgi:alkylation response protein AidB-like acyl-CoA dehydrogenase